MQKLCSFPLFKIGVMHTHCRVVGAAIIRKTNKMYQPFQLGQSKAACDHECGTAGGHKRKRFTPYFYWVYACYTSTSLKGDNKMVTELAPCFIAERNFQMKQRQPYTKNMIDYRRNPLGSRRSAIKTSMRQTYNLQHFGNVFWQMVYGHGDRYKFKRRIQKFRLSIIFPPAAPQKLFRSALSATRYPDRTSTPSHWDFYENNLVSVLFGGVSLGSVKFR